MVRRSAHIMQTLGDRITPGPTCGVTIDTQFNTRLTGTPRAAASRTPCRLARGGTVINPQTRILAHRLLYPTSKRKLIRMPAEQVDPA